MITWIHDDNGLYVTILTVNSRNNIGGHSRRDRCRKTGPICRITPRLNVWVIRNHASWNTRQKLHIYRPQRSWGKVIYSQASVILFTGGGGSASVHAGIPPPPGPGTPPWDQAPPIRAEHTGRYGQRAGGMHLTGMQFLLNSAAIRSLLNYTFPFSIKPRQTEAIKPVSDFQYMF